MNNRVSEYRIIYYYSFDDECYIANIPDLPGCISDGESIADAIENVRELAKDWIEIAIEDGESVPAPSLREFPAGDELHIDDVAVYILEKLGQITTKALQKMLYYCKAWSCGWYKRSLFSEEFEAWVGGPMNKELFNKHRRQRFVLRSIFDHENITNLSQEQKAFVDRVIEIYNEFDPDILVEMTHKEAPWLEARQGLPAEANCSNEITEKSLEEYYGQAS